MRLRYLGCLIFSAIVLTTSLAVARLDVETPMPSIDPMTRTMVPTGMIGPLGPVVAESTDPLTPGLISSAECVNFDDNPPHNGGYLFIPPDPHDAAGPEHVLNVVNLLIEWRQKAALTDAPQFRSSLDALFAGTPGMLAPTVPSNLFDPKCTYDQYAGRFVVVVLQVNFSPVFDSRILVAVSKTSDPNAGWWRHAIPSLLTISGFARWADYPGLATDDDALYITANMFNAAGTSYAGSRLWIVSKLPTYAGPDGSIVSSLYDAWALSGASAGTGLPGSTTMPTHMWGPEPAGVGTFLVSLGISGGVTEYMNVIRVDTPAAPAWNWQLLSLGDISSGAVPSATQLGGPRTISTVAQRVMNAVWRNNYLYSCNTIKPTLGVDSPQATAHWYRIDTSTLAALAVSDQGNVGGEDLSVGTHTYMPAVNVDKCDNMAIGFSASSPTLYAGAYYATRALGDAAGTIGASAVLALGTDYYVRTFSTSTTAASRWGDYTGMSLCPTDETTFWVYNEYACMRGTPTGSGATVEDGRWCTRVGSFQVCTPVSVAISSFSATVKGTAVSLQSTFRSDLGVQAVNVYRGSESGSLALINTIYTPDGRNFEYLDRAVEAGNAYRYQIGVTDSDGEFLSPIANVAIPRAVASLEQNTPNPFNPTTSIRFTLPANERVTIKVYDASGSLVRTLIDDVRPVGTHDVQWDGRDNSGATVGSGVYFYRIAAGSFLDSKKMVLLK